MGWFSWLWNTTNVRNSRKRGCRSKLSADTNVAGAGAELSGGKDDSETEEALRRASGSDRSSAD